MVGVELHLEGGRLVDLFELQELLLVVGVEVDVFVAEEQVVVVEDEEGGHAGEDVLQGDQLDVFEGAEVPHSREVVFVVRDAVRQLVADFAEQDSVKRLYVGPDVRPNERGAAVPERHPRRVAPGAHHACVGRVVLDAWSPTPTGDRLRRLLALQAEGRLLDFEEQLEAVVSPDPEEAVEADGDEDVVQGDLLMSGLLLGRPSPSRGGLGWCGVSR